MIGYVEGIDSERGLAWRCADSLSLKHFLGFEVTEATPDHSTISRTRRLIELGNTVDFFSWILQVLAKHHIPHDSRRYARQITNADARDFDYILAMDKGHLSRLQPLIRENTATTALFLSYANAAGTVKLVDVPDPWYTGRSIA